MSEQDNYADAEFKDRADFLGSSDSSLEQGVIAVGVAVVLWLFFRAFFLPFVLLALLYLFVRIFIGKTDPQALLARVMLLPADIKRWTQRLHVRVVVKMLPEDVTDAEDLKGRLFHSPPQNLDHQHYRDTFAILALTDRTEEQDLQLSQYLRGLKAYGEDPLRMMAGQLRRKIAPSTQPKSQGLAGVNAFAAPIPGLSMMTQYLAVALVVVGAWGVWGWRAKGGAERKEAAAVEALQTAESRNEGLATAIRQRDETVRQMNVNMEDYQNRVAEMQRRDAVRSRALAEARAKERERVEQARARADGSSPQLSDDDWLRNAATLVGPTAGGGDNRPAEPAADPAEGVAGGVLREGGGGEPSSGTDPQR